MLKEALQLIENKHYQEAQDILLSLVKEHPIHAELHFHLACTYDAQGHEREAIPYYEQALFQGLSGEHREEAYIQLGSSYRCIGEYQKAIQTLEQGLTEFPDNKAIKTFQAMALYNVGEHKLATSQLLRVLCASTSDEWIKKYSRAIQFYAEDLDQTW